MPPKVVKNAFELLKRKASSISNHVKKKRKKGKGSGSDTDCGSHISISSKSSKNSYRSPTVEDAEDEDETRASRQPSEGAEDLLEAPPTKKSKKPLTPEQDLGEHQTGSIMCAETYPRWSKQAEMVEVPGIRILQGEGQNRQSVAHEDRTHLHMCKTRLQLQINPLSRHQGCHLDEQSS